MSTGPVCTHQVPHYTLQNKLGAGGMGEVYLASHHQTGESVAIKFLTPPLGPNESQYRQRFEREARLMEQLSHPSIVRVLEHGVVAGQPYLVMEHVAGGNLRGWMTPGQPMALDKVRQVLAGVVSALVALEEAQIVHRDLKPENVLLDNEGQARVTDFGISVAVTDVGQLTSTTEVLGSLDYMAPEQRARLPADPRADQFALAVIVYEMLTGKRPLGNFKQPSQLRPQLHSTVDTVVGRALQEDPDDRFPTIREFAVALEQALARKGRRLRPSAALVAGLFVLCTAITTVWAMVYSTPNTDQVKPVAAVSIPQPAEPEIVVPEDPKEKIAYLVKLAGEHLAEGRAKESEAAYSEAIQLSPKDPALLVRRAILYKRAKMHQLGLADLDAALQLDPNLAEARLRRGEIYVQMGDYQLAMPELDEAIRMDPQGALAYAYRGWSQRRLENDDAALSDLNKAVGLDADCGVAYHYRGLMFLAQKKYAEALADNRESVRCTPDNPFAHSALASLLATCPETSLRDGELAVTHARRACELTQWKEWREVRTLARAHDQAGELPEAIRWCEKAMEMAPAEYRKGIRDQLTGYRKRVPAEAEAAQP